MASRKLIGAALAALAIAAVAAPGTAHAVKIEGEVTAKSKPAQTFTIAQERSRAFRIKVNATTEYQGIEDFGDIKVGMTDVQVTATRRSGNVWIASHVESAGGAGLPDED
jgi:hypothetical protein